MGAVAKNQIEETKALKAKIDRLETELEVARIEVARLEGFADQDPLLPEILNRRAFVREMSRIISFADRYEVDAALIYFDLQGFKQVNDAYGHGAGDQVLRRVGLTLRGNVRDSDLVGRLGGDEFAVVLAKADEAAARAKASDLAQLIGAEDVALEDGSKVRIVASYGVCCFKGKMDPEAAIANADKEMYAARARLKQ